MKLIMRKKKRRLEIKEKKNYKVKLQNIEKLV